MADIFISYKREDREHAESISQAITERGYTTWYDTSLAAGEQFVDSINAELEGAKAVCVLWSQLSYSSQWVKAEALRALEKNKLLSAKLDNIEMGVPFNLLHTTDLGKWVATKETSPLSEIFAGIRRFCGDPPVIQKSKAATVNVLFTRLNTSFFHDKTGKDTGRVDEETISKRLQNLMAETGIHVNIVNRGLIWNKDEEGVLETYASDINVFVLFGREQEHGEIGYGFWSDVVDPGLMKLITKLNPFILHFGISEYRDAYWKAARVIPASAGLGSASDLEIDNLIERLAAEICFHFLRSKKI